MFSPKTCHLMCLRRFDFLMMSLMLILVWQFSSAKCLSLNTTTFNHPQHVCHSHNRAFICTPVHTVSQVKKHCGLNWYAMHGVSAPAATYSRTTWFPVCLFEDTFASVLQQNTFHSLKLSFGACHQIPRLRSDTKRTLFLLKVSVNRAFFSRLRLLYDSWHFHYFMSYCVVHETQLDGHSACMRRHLHFNTKTKVEPGPDLGIRGYSLGLQDFFECIFGMLHLGIV